MLDIRSQILNLLKTAAGTGTSVFDQYPEDDADFPCVSFYESGNEEYRQASGAEYLTKIAYTIDIWGDSWSVIDPILHAINASMQGLGFRREFCADAPQPGIKHKEIRYTAIIDQDGMIYEQ